MNRLLAALALVLPFTGVGAAENWPDWRGSRLDGISVEKNLPLKWSETDNVAWKTAIPGVGYSSPIIFGDRIFLTTCLIKEQARVLLCVDRQSGRVLWSREVFRCPLEPVHKLNSRASFDASRPTVSMSTRPSLPPAPQDRQP